MIRIEMFGSLRSIPIILLALFTSRNASAQTISGWSKLESFARSAPSVEQAVNINQLSKVSDSEGNFNYIAPIVRLIQNKDSIIQKYGSYNYAERLATLLSFIGDYKKANELLHGISSPGFPDEVAIIPPYFKKLMEGWQFTDFFPYLYERATKVKVVMINEAHHRPEHRMTMLRILDSLYKLGYHTLAAEALVNREDKTAPTLPPTSRLGFYTAEPLLSDLIRYATWKGYQLVSYEQATSQSASRNRDSVQAINLINKAMPSDTSKLLVYVGYGHVEENSPGEQKAMAYYFKKISSIDPLTIDQVSLSFGGIKSIEQNMYDELLEKRSITHPELASNNGKIYSTFNLTDASLILPKPQYRNERPTWLADGNIKKECKITVDKKIRNSAFLIQAYYKKEIEIVGIEKLVPADQTYDKDQKFYSLFLFPGTYTIVIRDIEYKIISQKEITVGE